MKKQHANQQWPSFASYTTPPTPAQTPVLPLASLEQHSAHSSFYKFDEYDFVVVNNNKEEVEEEDKTDRTLQHPRPQRFNANFFLPTAVRVPSNTDDREDTKSAEHYAFPKLTKLQTDTDRLISSASVGPSTPLFSVTATDDRRAQSLSPSMFLDEQSSVGSNDLAFGADGVLGGAMFSRRLRKKKEEKKKHGSYKIWHRNASEELQVAYNAIYGLPLYGSVAFIGKKPFPSDDEDDEIQQEDEGNMTCVVKRFDGLAKVSTTLLNTWNVEIESAGKDDGDFSKILVNGRDYSENKRGFNMAVLVPETGEVKTGTFDTHGLPEESERLADFINDAPSGAYIFGSIRDDGAKFLGEMGRAALRLIGVKVPKADDALALREVVEALPPDRTRVLLTVCAKANAKNCAKVLLQNGWDIHTRASHTMNTPLHDAVYQKNTDIAMVLLECGADASLENKWGETPENIAQKKFGFASLEHMIMSSDRHIQSVIRFIGLE